MSSPKTVWAFPVHTNPEVTSEFTTARRRQLILSLIIAFPGLTTKRLQTALAHAHQVRYTAVNADLALLHRKRLVRNHVAHFPIPVLREDPTDPYHRGRGNGCYRAVSWTAIPQEVLSYSPLQT